MALKQAAVLHSAARLLKPGGRLVYATCSLLTQENETIAEAFTASNLASAHLQWGLFCRRKSLLALRLCAAAAATSSCTCACGRTGTRPMVLLLRGKKNKAKSSA